MTINSIFLSQNQSIVDAFLIEMSFGALIEQCVFYFIRLFGVLKPRYDETTKILYSPETRILRKHPTNRSLGRQMYDGLLAKSKQIVQVGVFGTKSYKIIGLFFLK